MRPYNTDIAIDILIDDISKINMEDQRANDIFALITAALNKLKEGAVSYLNGDYELYEQQIEEAYEMYKQALSERRSFMVDNNV